MAVRAAEAKEVKVCTNKVKGVNVCRKEPAHGLSVSRHILVLPLSLALSLCPTAIHAILIMHLTHAVFFPPCSQECKRMGSLKTLAKFQALLESREGPEVEVITVNCLGEYGMGPNVQINGDDGE